MVGIDKKNENSSADARDIPTNCPAAIVDIDRDVPGNTADKIWQAPIHTACPRFMSSMCQTRIKPFLEFSPACSDFALRASMNHITTPPTSRAVPMMYKL